MKREKMREEKRENNKSCVNERREEMKRVKKGTEEKSEDMK